MGRGVLIIRKATHKDIPAIERITKEAFKAYVINAHIPGKTAALEETEEDIQKDINNKLCFVAEVDGVVVGSVRVEINEEDKTAYLSRFGVALEYQSNGIGAKLLDHVDETMKEMGISKLYLHTASKLVSLIKFYYGRGFYIDSTTKDRGYIRALLCKEYSKESQCNKESIYKIFAV
ncbi:MAG: GNAT family N-acetyltransferase [Clostridiales bacterium]|uniref:GNAT family N-acetyltransferase n=1 Tax=Clostridium sp. N3C TaxID=1776758 RepID=UPI00092E0350|nr:GNAT family N-acetyltransferase [Clostridium sp. N3C]NLZ48845.1 GNAT family N-acetyltransferase [Clostridiales bacterium]SCN25225.1 putative acetyltransferase [Clostridium sp. N3C]